MLIIMGLVFTACTSPGGPKSQSSGYNSYVYQGIDFGSNRNETFKKGVRDACRTADGHYTKNHTLFNSDESYNVGWKDGRLKCKGK